MEKPQRLIGLGVSVAACFGAAAVGGAWTSGSVETWYPRLNKPSWNPPSVVFGPVWSALYLGMAVAAWRVWDRSRNEEKARRALALFGAQLALNVAWSGIFFGLMQPGWAALEIIALWGAIAATLLAFWEQDEAAGALMAPYLAWVTFAAALNLTIWRMNAG